MKLPKSISNWISITGFIFAINSLILIIVLFIQALLSEHQNPYNGIFTYIILPTIMVIGFEVAGFPEGQMILDVSTHLTISPFIGV